MIPVPEFNDKAISETLKSIPGFREMPDEFKFHYGTSPFITIVSDWFFKGLEDNVKEKLIPKEGVDKSEALKVIRGILGSWELKHEDKECKAAYLMNEWFTISESTPTNIIKKILKRKFGKNE